MKSMCVLSVCALVLLASVGCATHSMNGPYCGIVPNGYSNTRCGVTVCNDKLVPSADMDMLVVEHAPLHHQNRPFMRQPYNDYGNMGYYGGEGYTMRAPRDFFMSVPMPLGE